MDTVFTPLRTNNGQRIPQVTAYPGDPRFRYFGSSNPYVDTIEEYQKQFRSLSDCPVLANHQSEKLMGKWRTKGFNGTTESPLHIEIGPGIGRFLLKSAAENPDSLFVGVELKYKQAFKIGKKAHEAGLKNMKCLRLHAERIPLVFEQGEVDSITILFPDPWPKKAHWKNRLV